MIYKKIIYITINNNKKYNYDEVKTMPHLFFYACYNIKQSNNKVTKIVIFHLIFLAKNKN